jgi:hypothetical protein
MHQRVSRYAAAFLVLVSLATIACDGDIDMATASLTGPSAFPAGSTTAAVTADPTVIPAELRPSSACKAQPPFDARLSVTIHPSHDLFIRHFGFEFFDQFGGRVLPFVFPGTIQGNSAVLQPVPLPTSSPIPFPQVVMSRVAAEAGRILNVPFRLQFNCGVPARGTLLVSIETEDRRGTIDVSRIRAHIQ